MKSSGLNLCFCNDFIKSLSYQIFLLGTWSVNLHELQVPKQIMNDSLRHVVLDCRYSLNHTEKDGMILKWYLNGVTIYQWIPPARPQVSIEKQLNSVQLLTIDEHLKQNI